MDIKFDADHSRLKSNYRRLGLLYGILIGLAYALSTWGYDAIVLTRVDATYPFLKLLLGMVFCVIVGGIAGVIVGGQDSGLVAVIVWALAGVSYAWISAHLPFDITSKVIGLFDPKFKSLEIYPLPQVVSLRLNIILLVTAALAALSGALQLILLDAARSSSVMLGRWLSLLFGIPFIVFAGITNDGQFNQQLRNPLHEMHELIYFVLDHEGETIDPQVALDMHLSALRNVGDIIQEPQHLMIGGYDDRSMLSTSVEIDFGDVWIRCTVIHGNVSICWPTLALYQEELNCLRNQEESCRMTPSEEAQAWLDQYGNQLGEIPNLSIEAFQGTVILFKVNLENETTFLCRFRETQPILFESCSPVQ